MSKKFKKKDDELTALAELRDEEIDTSDIPESDDWSQAVRGRFYRPVKQSITIRLDADVIHWLKKGGRGYQTRVNKILRNAMEKQKNSSS
ncbi:BrnA antitoxin family protein [Geoalkalibacter halelectricus]|uniref:BrnA antitoxin family protein n=1 Tax=Geoalkalibacter halelectricus TaxID=2847045 RepID=A0ABY5ZMF5_9BACT|nr:BrnA antitoxin family protein [Geoalkalibacter halelectricus]MDO3378369.1 BrnA antitoxin family protein [Geoalkalibacter halelectricus]UWZ80311.1 BrnA antitoxin family protein [Geoalkalibacter halelectricus]